MFGWAISIPHPDFHWWCELLWRDLVGRRLSTDPQSRWESHPRAASHKASWCLWFDKEGCPLQSRTGCIKSPKNHVIMTCFFGKKDTGIFWKNNIHLSEMTPLKNTIEEKDSERQVCLQNKYVTLNSDVQSAPKWQLSLATLPFSLNAADLNSSKILNTAGARHVTDCRFNPNIGNNVSFGQFSCHGDGGASSNADY